MDSSSSEGSFAGGAVVAVCEASTMTTTTTTTTSLALKTVKETASHLQPDLLSSYSSMGATTTTTTTALTAVTEFMRLVIQAPFAKTLGIGDYARKMDGELGQPTLTLELVTFISE